MHRTLPRSVLALLLATTAGACDGSPPAEPDAGPDDAGGLVRDAGRDAGRRTDAGPPDAGPERAPIFRNPVSLSDEELAMQALRLMGAPEAGGSGSCAGCHAITRENIAHFWELTNTAWYICLADRELSTRAVAEGTVGCFQDSGLYSASKLGVFATGASLPWFPFAFRRAIGEGWEEEYERFRMRVQQPPDGHEPFTQAEFDLLTEWFLRRTPLADELLPGGDGPGECTPYVGPSVAGIVADGELTGWPARNREAAILMHGCAGASDPRDCLASYPRASETTYGALWETPGTTMRVLFEVPYRSSYWTKSSADGRFVAHGGNDGGSSASIIDLQRRVILGADAAFDPGFFPDNSGFMFQGTSHGPALCMQSVLTSGAPTEVTFSEPGCTGASGIGLYQHVGAALEGDDYWAVESLWSGDTGLRDTDPDVFASADADLTLFRLVNSGTGFTRSGSFDIEVPWEANAVVSPTMRTLVTQLADAAGDPLGFILHRIDITRDATGGVTDIELPEIARYCYPGGKGAISLDDRWLVTHHRVSDEDAVDLGFTGPSDPGFAAYRGVANVYLIDLLTGERTRVTNMQPGQQALFPHFRSDGWLYFLVRSAALPEYVVASDAGIVLR